MEICVIVVDGAEFFVAHGLILCDAFRICRPDVFRAGCAGRCGAAEVCLVFMAVGRGVV